MFLSHIITYNALKTVHLQIHKFNERKAFISYAFSLTVFRISKQPKITRNIQA